MEALLGKTLEEIQELVVQIGMPKFSAKQIADWLYCKRVSTIDDMTNISLKYRNLLKEKYIVGRYTFTNKQESTDGTVKYLFPVDNGKCIETVYLPEKERATLCVSSQVGCKMNCLFCMTGKQGFDGNLSSRDIINQIMSIPDSDKLTNVVFMGMGEPLDNYSELMKALEILTAEYGFAWSPKRITVSTIGLVPALKRFIEESQVHLAVSVHSPFHDERVSLMPVEKAYPVKDVLDLVRDYDFSHQRRFSLEYIMFGGLNDSLRHAKALADLIKDIPARVNLIKYHKIPGIDLPSSDMKMMENFRDFLNSKGIISTIRRSRGEDILAACGMLSSKNNNAI
ncbi:23S rRNA (adenine2503-C2)-methyltransferase [Dysgonomonadaceae bacterium PH5-43]|nr:23S rRNA (adenine2503-C2)-methyltransferase [Dysgonomonadaceae bacterium PH5-43]